MRTLARFLVGLAVFNVWRRCFRTPATPSPVAPASTRNKRGATPHPCADVHARNVAALADEMRGMCELRGLRWVGLDEHDAAGVYVARWRDRGHAVSVHGLTQAALFEQYRAAMAAVDARDGGEWCESFCAGAAHQ